jgi:hypothetical protein
LAEEATQAAEEEHGTMAARDAKGHVSIAEELPSFLRPAFFPFLPLTCLLDKQVAQFCNVCFHPTLFSFIFCLVLPFVS